MAEQQNDQLTYGISKLGKKIVAGNVGGLGEIIYLGRSRLEVVGEDNNNASKAVNHLGI